MRTKLVCMLGIAAVAGFCAFAPAARAQAVDNSNDTVHCDTVTKGVIKLAPPLKNGGTLGAVIKIGGTLGGCVSPSNPSLVFPEGKSKFKGVLNSATNDCAGLAGPSTTSGTLTFTWGVASPGVTQKVSTVTIPSGGSVGSFTAIGSGAYGVFGLGAPQGGAALSVTGGFTGGDGGAGSSGYVITTQSVASILSYCASLTGLKAINIGVSQIDLN